MARWLARGILVAAAAFLVGLVVVELVLPNPESALLAVGLACVVFAVVWALARVETEGW